MRFFEILIENHSKYLVGGTNFYDRLSQFSYQTNSFLLWNLYRYLLLQHEIFFFKISKILLDLEL